MVLAPFVNYNMDAIFPFCAEAAQFQMVDFQINLFWMML
jgi:hypothetical protein